MFINPVDMIEYRDLLRIGICDIFLSWFHCVQLEYTTIVYNWSTQPLCTTGVHNHCVQTKVHNHYVQLEYTTIVYKPKYTTNKQTSVLSDI